MNNASKDVVQELVAQVKIMSTRIRALEVKLSRLQVEVNKKKGRTEMEDISEKEDTLIEWVGRKIECGHN